MCVICLDVALDPMQHEQCKKLLCEQCKDRWHYFKGDKITCPYCGEEGAKFLPHKESKLLIILGGGGGGGCASPH